MGHCRRACIWQASECHTRVAEQSIPKRAFAAATFFWNCSCAARFLVRCTPGAGAPALEPWSSSRSISVSFFSAAASSASFFCSREFLVSRLLRFCLPDSSTCATGRQRLSSVASAECACQHAQASGRHRLTRIAIKQARPLLSSADCEPHCMAPTPHAACPQVIAGTEVGGQQLERSTT